jgi:hypothetical protein
MILRLQDDLSLLATCQTQTAGSDPVFHLDATGDTFRAAVSAIAAGQRQPSHQEALQVHIAAVTQAKHAVGNIRKGWLQL